MNTGWVGYQKELMGDGRRTFHGSGDVILTGNKGFQVGSVDRPTKRNQAKGRQRRRGRAEFQPWIHKALVGEQP